MVTVLLFCFMINSVHVSRRRNFRTVDKTGTRGRICIATSYDATLIPWSFETNDLSGHRSLTRTRPKIYSQNDVFRFTLSYN